ncbi:uncharacterized protein [Ptychodera flava]
MDFNHAPLGAINIRKAALSLYPEQQYQFCVSSEDKEHILTAEDHRSMMHWLNTLQAKRDFFAEKHTVQYFNEEQYRKHQAKNKSGQVTEGVEVAAEAKSDDDELEDNTDSGSIGKRRQALNHIHQDQDGQSLDSFTGISVTSESTENGDSPSSSYLSAPETEGLEESGICDGYVALSGKLSVNDENIALRTQLRKIREELDTTKKELKRHQRRDLAYRELLEAREKAIVDLSEQVDLLETMQSTKRGSDPNNHTQKMKDKCRELQDHAVFLNNEIQKLSKHKQRDDKKITERDKKILEYESEIQKLKRDYVFLLQSCISVSTGEGPHELQLCLFGGDAHLTRISELLDECRLTDPKLPDARTVLTTGHVDQHGFQHQPGNQGITLHYLCQLLHQHYTSQMKEQENHQSRWNKFLTEHTNDLHNTPQVQNLVRNGIPSQHRLKVWTQLAMNHVQDIRAVKGEGYYKSLVSQIPESIITNSYQRQIELDLLRTMPQNIHFKDTGSDKISELDEVLKAFCIHNPEIGYCQGLNFIVATCLLYMDAEMAFWCLVTIVEKFFPDNYFDRMLIGAQADQCVLKELLEQKLPHLHQHITSVEIDLSTITLNWFMSIFFDSVPFQTLLRIWDCFFLEGPIVLFRFSLAIMKIHENKLLQECDTISIMRQMKSIAKLSFDVEGLVQVAFEGLEPFPERDFISKRQQIHMKRLKEHFGEREKERQDLEEAEKLWQTAQQLEKTNVQAMEWATTYKPGRLWICQGRQNEACICDVNINTGIKQKLPIQFDSRVMCITAVSEEVVLLGTLSWYLYAYSTKTKSELWCLPMRDTVLSVAYNYYKKTIYVGLADGTLVVYDNVKSIKTAPSKDNMLFLSVSTYPISCLLVFEQQRQLWCSCGNLQLVLNSGCLDIISGFEVSSNRCDHISRLVYSTSGIWIAIRGTSLLQLWDPRTFICLLVYDIASNAQTMINKNEDSYFNVSRVTSLLFYGNELWVGSGDGSVSVYRVKDQRSPPPHFSQLSLSGDEVFMNNPRRVSTKSQSMAFLNCPASPTMEGDPILQSCRLPRSLSFAGDYQSPTGFRKDGSRKSGPHYRKWSSQDDSDVIHEEAKMDEKEQTGKGNAEKETIDSPLVLEDVIPDYFAVRNDTKTVRSQNSLSADPVSLELLFKHKQSDNPIRCLTLTRKENDEPRIISCAGCYGDVGDILEWRYNREKEEWCQDQVTESVS